MGRPKGPRGLGPQTRSYLVTPDGGRPPRLNVELIRRRTGSRAAQGGGLGRKRAGRTGAAALL